MQYVITPPAPLPPALTVGSRIRLTLVGWLDRWRYRKLADSQHTHLTLRLRAVHDAGCAAVEGWRAAADAARTVRLAELGEPTGPDRLTLTARSSDELADLDPHGRLRWAEANRAAVVAADQFNARLDETERARTERRRLIAERAELPDLAAIARLRWRHDLDVRLATYTRARIGGFAAAPTTSAVLPTTVANASTAHSRHLNGASR